jgi:periplasmic divalent cation tolerance protein
MPASLIYITCKNADEAAAIGRLLVAEKHVACANILPATTAIYEWGGAICSESEAILLLKTATDAVATVTERVKALQSYDLPCVIALPVTGGNQTFLDWVETHSRQT